MDGLQQLEAIFDGRLPPPPIAETVGMEGFRAERGKVSVELDAARRHYNPIGSVHGGVISRCSTPPPAAPSTRPWRPASSTRRSTSP